MTEYTRDIIITGLWKLRYETYKLMVDKDAKTSVETKKIILIVVIEPNSSIVWSPILKIPEINDKTARRGMILILIYFDLFSLRASFL